MLTKIALVMLFCLVFSNACGDNKVLAGIRENMVFVKGGSFQLGSEGEEENVIQAIDFYINKYEVTQKEWLAVMGKNPSHFDGENLPVERVSWYDAIVFCNQLSILVDLEPVYSINGSSDPADWGEVPTVQDPVWDDVVCNWDANGYRLPTEDEWEFAAHGGLEGEITRYAGSNRINDVAWYYRNSGRKTHPVGSKQPNELGLYDMCGNVLEWCWDWHDIYGDEIHELPEEAIVYSARMLRGGSWYSFQLHFCRITYQIEDNPFNRNYTNGLRLVQTAKSK